MISCRSPGSTRTQNAGVKRVFAAADLDHARTGFDEEYLEHVSMLMFPRRLPRRQRRPGKRRQVRQIPSPEQNLLRDLRIV